jgi:hypothetical protein
MTSGATKGFPTRIISHQERSSLCARSGVRRWLRLIAICLLALCAGCSYFYHHPARRTNPLPVAELPARVVTSLRARYPEAVATEAYKTVYYGSDKVWGYSVWFQWRGSVYEAFFTPRGRFEYAFERRPEQ